MAFLQLIAYVTANKLLEPKRFCSCGCPSGSLLGPYLFSLFINDLPSILKQCDRTLHANDTLIYLHAFPSELDDAISLIERDAQSAADGAARNGLELNEEKPKSMIMGSLQYTSVLDESSKYG